MSVEWRPIEGYENYSVSDTGLVKNTRTGRILAFTKDKDGYLSAGMPKNGKVQKFRVHRLVAQAFIPNPNRLATVDHKNGNKEDNNASNLQWLSYGDNLEKYWKNHRKPVVCLESGIVYRSAYHAAAELELSPQHIAEVCHKKRKHEKHLHFEYLQEQAV